MYNLKLQPLPFLEAIEHFRDKVTLTPEEFNALADEYKVKAFTVAGIAALDILNDIYQALLKALAEGLTMEEFRQSVNEVLEKRGWQGLTPLPGRQHFQDEPPDGLPGGAVPADDRPGRAGQEAILDVRRGERPAHQAHAPGHGRQGVPGGPPLLGHLVPPNGYR